MIIYPAMDLMNGRVVRLLRGRFEDATSYAADPRDALAAFARCGATWAHVVDLDGARQGAPAQHDLVEDLAGSAPLKLQVAGGFRTRDEVARMFEAGAARVVIGSLAVEDPDAVTALLREFGAERIALALDVRVESGAPMVRTRGWTQDPGLSLWDVAARFPDARHLLLTDIGRDGMLGGPNFELLAEACGRLPHLDIQASGGVSSLEDLARLDTAAAILGKALWEGRIALEEAVRLASA